MLKKSVLDQQARYSDLLKRDLPVFNAELGEEKITGIIVPKIE
jgi:hypothetical protein